MRKVNVILMAFVLLVSTTMLTAANNPVLPITKTSEEIAELLKDPGFIFETEVTAQVTFVINKSGEIVVLSVDSENDSIKRFIKQRLNYQKIDSKNEQGKEFVVPVRIISD